MARLASRRAQTKRRNKDRDAAASLGLSYKVYRVSLYPSVGWNHVIETIRRRCKQSNVQCTITAKYVRSLWDAQSGVCPLTGWAMEQRKTGTGLTMQTVTVDRIDQSLGYVKGNVRLVAFAANNARYTWTDEQFIDLCRSVVNRLG